MLEKYVGSKLLKTNAAPNEDIINGPGSWIQITAVNPVIDYKKWSSKSFNENWLHWETGSDSIPLPSSLCQNPEADRLNPEQIKNSSPNSIYVVEPELNPDSNSEYSLALDRLYNLPENIRSYFLSNEVNTFSFVRPFKRPIADSSIPKDDPAREFLELWTEKTLFFTEDSFPCLLQRSEVSQAIVIEMSPIENAIVTVRTKSRQLKEFEQIFSIQDSNHGRQHQSLHSNLNVGPASRNVNTFTMALNGAVDAPVNGGVPMYRNAFLGDAYRVRYPDHIHLINMLQNSINEQV